MKVRKRGLPAYGFSVVTEPGNTVSAGLTRTEGVIIFSHRVELREMKRGKLKLRCLKHTSTMHKGVLVTKHRVGVIDLFALYEVLGELFEHSLTPPWEK